MLKLNKDVSMEQLKSYGFEENGAYQEYLSEDVFPVCSLEIDLATNEVSFYTYEEYKASDNLLLLIYNLIKDGILIEE